jgi:large subunit ribosomal protein L13
MKHTIDASQQKIGRIATKAAVLLMGKNLPNFKRNVAPKIQVEIINASKVDVTAKKLRDTAYPRYSGYPGGLRFESMGQIATKKGFAAVIEEAVKGMLPKNKLQNGMLKNLTITE